jgi:hypothetical protein
MSASNESNWGLPHALTAQRPHLGDQVQVDDQRNIHGDI